MAEFIIAPEIFNIAGLREQLLINMNNNNALHTNTADSIQYIYTYYFT